MIWKKQKNPDFMNVHLLVFFFFFTLTAYITDSKALFSLAFLFNLLVNKI